MTKEPKVSRPYRGGCLHCPGSPDLLEIDTVLYNGFGGYSVTKDGNLYYAGKQGGEWESYKTLADIESEARKEPNADWRVKLDLPLRDGEWQRHGNKEWVLSKVDVASLEIKRVAFTPPRIRRGTAVDTIRAIPWWVWLIPIAVLLIATARLPYGYYIFMRLVVCVAAAFIAFFGWVEDSAPRAWSIVLALIAVLFNPLVPIHLRRETWFYLDIGTAAVFAAHLLFVRLEWLAKKSKK